MSVQFSTRRRRSIVQYCPESRIFRDFLDPWFIQGCQCSGCSGSERSSVGSMRSTGKNGPRTKSSWIQSKMIASPFVLEATPYVHRVSDTEIRLDPSMEGVVPGTFPSNVRQWSVSKVQALTRSHSTGSLIRIDVVAFWMKPWCIQFQPLEQNRMVMCF